jgi:hypothetical protein
MGITSKQELEFERAHITRKRERYLNTDVVQKVHIAQKQAATQGPVFEVHSARGNGNLNKRFALRK